MKMLSEIPGGRRNISRGLRLPYGEMKKSILAWAKHRQGIVLSSQLPWEEKKNRQILLKMAQVGICQKLAPNTHGGKYEPQFLFSAFLK